MKSLKAYNTTIVAAFGYKHHQITPSNHAFQTNNKESNKDVSRGCSTITAGSRVA